MSSVGRLSNTGVSTIVAFLLLFASGYFYSAYWLYSQSSRQQINTRNGDLLIMFCAGTLAISYALAFSSLVIPTGLLARNALGILQTFAGLSFVISLLLASKKYADSLKEQSGESYSELLLVLFNVVYLNEWQNTLVKKFQRE